MGGRRRRRLNLVPRWRRFGAVLCFNRSERVQAAGLALGVRHTFAASDVDPWSAADEDPAGVLTEGRCSSVRARPYPSTIRDSLRRRAERGGHLQTSQRGGITVGDQGRRGGELATLLIVDDEPALVTSIARELRAAGHVVY